MHEPAMAPRLREGTDIEEGRGPAKSGARLSPLVEARGVLRDVLAAVRNLEDLLRSPRVGPRALAPVIPGLKGFCAPLLEAVDDILTHVQQVAPLPVDDAALQLGSYVKEISERLRTALDRASVAALDAKNRLAFEGAVAQVGAELNSVRQLLDLLIHAS